MNENEQRAAVVAEALTWQTTPYHPSAQIKGAGVDCLTLLVATFTAVGLIRDVEVPYYPNDYMHHRDAEQYLEGLLQYTTEIDGPPLPGDIALWKFGRCYSHGAIVVAWPTVVHACAGRNVSTDDAEAAAWLTHVGENTADRGRPRLKKFFSYWPT